MKDSQRSPSLDLLRLIAVILVLGSHMNLLSPAAFYTQIFESDLWFGASAVADAWNRGGWVGVDLFFVISGFLVSGILFKEHRETGSIDAKRFIIRRAFKIYPAFYFLLIVTGIVYIWSDQPIRPKAAISELFFLQSYIRSIWPHTWSLAVEEHFYLILPFLLIGVGKLDRTATGRWKWLPNLIILIMICDHFSGQNFLFIKEVQHGTHKKAKLRSLHLGL